MPVAAYMGYFEVPEVDYTRYTNRQLAAVPLAVLAVALAILGGWYVMFGTPVSLGLEFGGGTEMTVETTTGESDLPTAFEQEPTNVQTVQAADNQYIVQFTSTEQEALSEQAEANLEPTGER